MASQEQRRSHRYPCEVEVELSILGQVQRLRSLDVSRHGLFVKTNTPPRERYLIQATIHLPDGPLSATAYVSRTVRVDGHSGVGLQLFAISMNAKERWDRFVMEQAGETERTPSGRHPHEDSANFLVKLPSMSRLREFQLKTLPTGRLYLATPVLRGIGAHLSVVIIHPLTESEFTIDGTVVRVHTENPRGMEIKLRPINDADWKAFYRFVESGEGAVPSERSGTPSRNRPIEHLAEDRDSSVFEQIRNAHEAEAAAELVADRKAELEARLIASSEPELEVEIEPDAPAGVRTTALSPVNPEYGEPFLLYDERIVPSDGERFEWSNISDDLVIDLDLGQYSEEPAHPSSIPAPFETYGYQNGTGASLPRTSSSSEFLFGEGGPFALESEPTLDLDDPVPAETTPEPPPQRLPEPPASTSGEISPWAAHESPEPWLEEPPRALSGLGPPLLEFTRKQQIEVLCTRCGHKSELALGDAEGVFGLLARYRPYWSAPEKKLVAVLRLKPARDRRSEIEKLGGLESAFFEVSVPLRFAFELADLTAPPRTESSIGKLRFSDAARAVEEWFESGNAEGEVQLAPCEVCRRGRWKLKRLPEPEIDSAPARDD